MDSMGANGMDSKKNLLIGAIVAIVVGGGVFYYLNMGKEDVVFEDDDTTQEVVSEIDVTDGVQDTFTTEASSTEGYMTFMHSSEGFQMDYPNEWEVDTSSDMILVAFYSQAEGAEDLFSENINLTTEDTTTYGEVSLQEYADAGLENIQVALPEYVLTDQGTRTFAGQEGSYLLGTYPVQGIELEIYSLFTIVNGKAYVLTYTYESSQAATYQAVADAMIDSFKLI